MGNANTNFMKLYLINTIFLGLLASSLVKAQPNRQLVSRFIRDLGNKNVIADSLITNYLCFDKKQLASNVKEKNCLFAKSQINDIREYIISNKLDLSKIKLYEYRKIDKKDKNLILSKSDSVYCSYIENEVFLYFKIKNNKISSFTTVNSGKLRFFILYCDMPSTERPTNR